MGCTVSCHNFVAINHSFVHAHRLRTPESNQIATNLLSAPTYLRISMASLLSCLKKS